MSNSSKPSLALIILPLFVALLGIIDYLLSGSWGEYTPPLYTILSGVVGVLNLGLYRSESFRTWWETQLEQNRYVRVGMFLIVVGTTVLGVLFVVYGREGFRYIWGPLCIISGFGTCIQMLWNRYR
jgi:hypothetical protein